MFLIILYNHYYRVGVHLSLTLNLKPRGPSLRDLSGGCHPTRVLSLRVYLQVPKKLSRVPIGIRKKIMGNNIFHNGHLRPTNYQVGIM